MAKARTATTFEDKVKWAQEYSRLFVDKYCCGTFLYTFNEAGALYKDVVHDSGLFEYSRDEYRPEDAWLTR